MSNLDFQLGLLFGHLGRSSPKFKAEGLGISVPKLEVELGMSAQEITAILRHAEAEGMLEVTLIQAVVKLVNREPEPPTTGVDSAPVQISDSLPNHPVAQPPEETADGRPEAVKAAKKGGRHDG
jgi:hypothetical protein